jgi:hypothetical protein
VLWSLLDLFELTLCLRKHLGDCFDVGLLCEPLCLVLGQFKLNMGLCELGLLAFFFFYNMVLLGIEEDFVNKGGESKRLIVTNNGCPSVEFSEVAEVSESLVELSQNLFHLFFLLDRSHLGLPVNFFFVVNWGYLSLSKIVSRVIPVASLSEQFGDCPGVWLIVEPFLMFLREIFLSRQSRQKFPL